MAAIVPFYVARQYMPQIDDIPRLLAYLKQTRISYRTYNARPGELRFHQRVAYVNGIDSATLSKPIIASRDKYILDGNHRYFGNAHNGVDTTTIEIGLDFWPAYWLILSLPFVHTGDTEERRVNN